MNARISSVLFAAATSLNAFWIMNVTKEAVPAVKAFFNFYPVTGPLLGLYLASLAIFAAAYGISIWLMPESRTPERAVSWYFYISVVLFFFAVFPPVYELLL